MKASLSSKTKGNSLQGIEGPAITILFLLALFGTEGRAQSEFQRLTPSFVLDSGVFEGKLFNSLYTQKERFSPSGERSLSGLRSSYFTNIGQFLYGVGSGINLGLEAWGRSVRIGSRDRSPFHLFSGGTGMGRRTALTYLGPRIKFPPVEEWRSTSMEVALLFPIAPDLEGEERDDPYLADDRYQLMSKFFYDRSLTPELRLFVRFIPWLSLDRRFRGDQSYLATPLSVFLSYIPHPRFTIYSQSEYWPTYGKGPSIRSAFYQQGLGVKYMLIEDRLEGELLYSKFLFGKNTGAGQSFGLGARVLLGK